MYLRESTFQTVLFYKTRILRKADFSSQFRTKSASQSTRRPLIIATVNKPWRLFVEQQSKDYQLKSSDLKARKPASRPQFSDCATNRDPDLNCIVFVEQQSKDYQLKSSDLKARKPASRPQFSDCATRDPDLNCIVFVEQQSKDYQLKSSDLKARKPASRPQFSDCATNRDPDLNCIVFCVHQLTQCHKSSFCGEKADIFSVSDND